MGRNTATPPPVPTRAKKELGAGTLAGLLAAEAMSSVRLFGLGERVGFAWYLAWLLPAALDIYAITMVRFFSLVPSAHPMRRKAAHEAIIALVITVSCNAVYETIIAFASQLPAWAPRALFVIVSALAPFVAGRLIHFRSEVGNGDTDAAPVTDTKNDTKSDTAKKSAKPKNDIGPDTGTTVDTDTRAPGNDTADTVPAPTSDSDTAPIDTGRPPTSASDTSEHPERSLPWWAEKAAPLYRQWMREHNGTPPKAPMLADLLAKAKYDVPAGEVQRRKIRAATETHVNENPESEPEADRVEVAA